MDGFYLESDVATDAHQRPKVGKWAVLLLLFFVFAFRPVFVYWDNDAGKRIAQRDLQTLLSIVDFDTQRCSQAQKEQTGCHGRRYPSHGCFIPRRRE